MYRPDAAGDDRAVRRETGRRRPLRPRSLPRRQPAGGTRPVRPDTRIVLAAHNAHIQRTANPDGIPLPRVPMGHAHAQRFGTDYVSVVMTSAGGRTVQNVPDPAHPAGMRQCATDAPATAPDSVALFAGNPAALAVLDTRAVRAHARRHGLPEPTLIRMDDGFLPVPALDAYDAVICIPHTTLSADLTG
ncbi:erythromycin esterase family protein [Streptomyces sp. NPDC086989]|uniref:erythromycin esterase family protein n=1 Tax=Streptomyces sp. NPDC086989 TaxID=3365764 RepID=UPI0038142D1C